MFGNGGPINPFALIDMLVLMEQLLARQRGLPVDYKRIAMIPKALRLDYGKLLGTQGLATTDPNGDPLLLTHKGERVLLKLQHTGRLN